MKERPIEIGIAHPDNTWSTVYLAIPIRGDIPTEALVERFLSVASFDMVGYWISWDIPEEDWPDYEDMVEGA